MRPSSRRLDMLITKNRLLFNHICNCNSAGHTSSLPAESMAESILQGIAHSLTDKVVALVASEVSSVWCVKDELGKLQRILISIRAVLADAEQRQSREHSLQVWLENLGDVLCDSENVLDEFECEELRKRVIKQGNLLRKISHFFSSSSPLAVRVKMGHKIKKVTARLDEITAQKDAFNLNQQTNFTSISHRIWRETHSRVKVSEVIGRDYDREVIVKHIIRADANTNPFIVSIVGIGGIGKTALTKLVYNDERVKHHFDSRIWVCVSEEFELKIILLKIIKSAIDESIILQSIHLLEVEQLQVKLHEIFQDKKFLLVLDDVWSDNWSKWNDLRDLLTGGNIGSSVIVTTRSSKVASAGGSCYEHKLEQLSHWDSMSVFRRTLDVGHGRIWNPELLEIANHIVERCGGVPLVVRAIGGLLRSNTDVNYWRSIRDKDIFTVLHEEGDILPVIRLSYDHLPAHLKRCFAFCSLYPKDLEFTNLVLSQCWIAIGVIGISENNQKPEEVCDQYIKELLARSFFQDLEETGAIYRFKMHDIVHDLALSIAQNEYSVVKFDGARISHRVRHVSFSGDPDNQLVQVPPFLRQANKLQTLSDASNSKISKEVLKACVRNCKYLRVLNLRRSTFEELPTNIDSLKHLRLLNLFENTKIKKLPKSICNLHSLQCLYFDGCESLEELPRDMWKLINLQHLGITTRQRSLKGCGIERLKSLQSMWIWKCNNLETLFGEMNMEGLTSLRFLKVYGCEKLKSIPMGCLKLVTSLEVIYIHYCRKLDFSKEDQIFSSRLRTLLMEGLASMLSFPRWVQGAANTLQSLTIINCPQLEELPEWLHKFSHLETLEIHGCSGILTLPDGVHDLTTLKTLIIGDCGALGERCRPNGPDWYKIAHIPNIDIDGDKMVPN